MKNENEMSIMFISTFSEVPILVKIISFDRNLVNFHRYEFVVYILNVKLLLFTTAVVLNTSINFKFL